MNVQLPSIFENFEKEGNEIITIEIEDDSDDSDETTDKLPNPIKIFNEKPIEKKKTKIEEDFPIKAESKIPNFSSLKAFEDWMDSFLVSAETSHVKEEKTPQSMTAR